jgi:hypothetical protein
MRRRPLCFDALRHVARHGNRAQRRGLDVALHEGEGHLDIESAAAFMRRAGEGRATLQLHYAACHGGLETAPMRRPQMLGDDQVEVLPERLGSTVAKQRYRTLIPPPDRPCAVRVDNGVGDLVEDPLGQ